MVCLAVRDRSADRPMKQIDELSDSGLLRLSPQELAQLRQMMLTSLRQRLTAQLRDSARPPAFVTLDDREQTQYNP